MTRDKPVPAWRLILAGLSGLFLTLGAIVMGLLVLWALAFAFAELVGGR